MYDAYTGACRSNASLNISDYYTITNSTYYITHDILFPGTMHKQTNRSPGSIQGLDCVYCTPVRYFSSVSPEGKLVNNTVHRQQCHIPLGHCGPF